jgi:hemerythrin-like domain-containing protein
MQPVSYFRDQHEEILKMVEELRPLLKKEQLQVRLVAKTARSLLGELADKIKGHLAEEDKDLYPVLLTHSELDVRSTAWKFISGEQSLRQAFAHYSKNRLKSAEFEHSDALIEETNDLLEALTVRIDREEQFLYPKFEAAVEKENADG